MGEIQSFLDFLLNYMIEIIPCFRTAESRASMQTEEHSHYKILCSLLMLQNPLLTRSRFEHCGLWATNSESLDTPRKCLFMWNICVGLREP